MKKIIVGLYVVLIMYSSGALAFDHLEVVEVRESNSSYEVFCSVYPNECDLTDSEKIIAYDDEVFSLIKKVSKRVNESVSFINDNEQYGVEEYWSLPTARGGDCEDNALKKRSVLVSEYGFPRGALRMVTAFHSEKFYAHAVLAVLTTKGAFILDQDNKDVVLAKKANYIFEAMELPGRKWARFDQQW